MGEVARRGPLPALPPRRPGELSPAARTAVTAGMPESTRRAYTEDIKRFASWCAEHGHGDLPTDGTTLTEYATYAAYTCGWTPVSIERARWAILKWHSLAEVPPPSTDGLVGVLKGYRDALAKSKSPKAKPRKATPASRGSLVAMLATLDRSSPAGKRNAAIILLGFAVAGRRGEIASLDIGDLDFQDRGLQVSVYRQKTRTMDDPVVQYRPDKAVCPVRAVTEWADALATAGRTAGPLFVRIDRHGHIGRQITRDGHPIGNSDGRMTGQAIAEVVHRSAISAGLGGKWSGHSLRRGLATAMHQAGAERRSIERQGGWEAGSRAVSGYIEDGDRWLVDVLDGVL